jgi:uncharacterized protein
VGTGTGTGDFPVSGGRASLRTDLPRLGAARRGTFTEPTAEAGSGVVTDPANRTQIQIDVAVLAASAPGEPRRVLSLGEAKWGRVMGMRNLSRLARARDLLTERGLNAADAKLACYSSNGFDGFDGDLLETAGKRADVLLVDPGLLYA